jgi:hypothetical protein
MPSSSGHELGPDRNPIRYETKLFTVSVIALDVDGLELGHHHIDLSRLLPDEDVDDPNVRHGSGWSTSFPLSGKAKPGNLDATFNYDMLHYEPSEGNDNKDDEGEDGLTNDAVASEDDAILNDDAHVKGSVSSGDSVLTTDADNHFLNSKQGLTQDSMASLGLLAEKSGFLGIDETCTGSSSDNITSPGTHVHVSKTQKIESTLGDVRGVFNHEVFIRHGYEEWIEESKDIHVTDLKLVESGAGGSSSPRALAQDRQAEQIRNTFSQIESTIAQMESSLKSEVSMSHEIEEWSIESEDNEGVEVGEGLNDVNDDDKPIVDFQTEFDEEIELVAGEFLDMLDIGFGSGNSNSEDETDSPRERLLRQCVDLFPSEDASLVQQQNCVVPYGNKLQEDWESDEDSQLASIMEAAELELQRAAQSERSRSRAKALEDEETQALMREWGLSEKAFQNSPPKFNRSSSMLGPQLPIPPPLGNGLGPVVNLKDGGSLRSMSPSHFSNKANSGSALVLQASKPVVVPSTMGTTAVDILRHLASFGMETLGKQAMAAMPLQDITGMLTNEAVTMKALEMDQNPQPGNR